jgi:DNA-binding NtrC family response regulator
MRQTVVVIDDDPALCALIVAELGAHRVLAAASADEGLALVRDEEAIDAVVTDLSMAGMSGVELCARLHALRPSLPVILMTAYGTLDAAVAALRAGAFDFVTKPFNREQLVIAVERAVATSAVGHEVARVRAGGTHIDANNLIGRSAAMDRLRDLVARVADSEATILVTGESGTGKELVARAIHDRSGRKGDFVAINCAAMPESLLESELFGHARGAFTDASTTRAGLFVRANGGTILLDEIGEMPAGMQAKLLRAVQERRVRPVGSDHELPFDARIVAATHRDLEDDVAQGHFREDLFYRINVVRVDVPPLRQRENDALVLAQRFLDETAASPQKPKGFSTAVARRLLAYSWPGNVRQLQNCIARAVSMSNGDELQLGDLPTEILVDEAHEGDVGLTLGDEMPTMDEIERRYIRRMLVTFRGNKTAVAQALGFDRRTLYRKLATMDAKPY